MFGFEITFKRGIKDTAFWNTGSLNVVGSSFVLSFGWGFQRSPRE